MKQLLTIVTLLIAIPACVFAIDGQVLINQAAVNAAGGFPYKITQPGSYKLSGNLVMNTSAQPNFPGMDVAILIGANNVNLDLNGFSITVNDVLGQALGHPFYAIAESGAFSQITITNGSARVTTNTNRLVLTAINMPSSLVMTFENLNLVGKAPVLDVAPPAAHLLIAGGNSLVRRVVTDGNIDLRCPSSAIDNVAFISQAGPGCVVVNQPGSLFVGVP